MGARTLLLTHRIDTIGALSCNPAIGGIGKGHLVREIDALDGVMGRAADRAGIHFKVLNRSKGPAVRGPRAQMDRPVSPGDAGALGEQPGLTIVAGEAADIELGAEGAVAAVLDATGTRYACAAAVMTTGTFLNGTIHVGDAKSPGGRVGEAPGAAARRSPAQPRPAGGPAEDRHAAAAWPATASTGIACPPMKARPFPNPSAR